MVEEKSSSTSYLSDSAVNKLTEDKFKHAEIAKIIKQITMECPMPFTIGLFGSWGTGKTTISNFFRDMLLKIEKIAVVYFDVWKYERDCLRRQFLITLVDSLKKQKKLGNKFKLNKALFFNIGTPEIKIKWLTWLIHVSIYIIPLVLIFIINVYCYRQMAMTNSAVFIFTVIYLLVFLKMLYESIKTIAQSISVETTTIEQDRLSEPDEFESEFDRVLKEMENVDRLIIVIDNLDRCEHRKATELLSTVKTFLEKDKCVYVVQCDEKAIKDHLKKVYEEIDPDEYLRKFFNTVINIPSFIRSDLDNYTEKLLGITKIPEFNASEVGTIITTAFRENPRRIKQFINMLISYLLLAKERESEISKSLLPEGVITKNIPFLTKFLILRHNWPDFFEIVKDDPSILDEINFSYRDHKIQLIEKIKNILNKDRKLDDFLRSTQLYTTKYPRAFLYLKQSSEELKIPESEDIRIALLDGKQSFIEEKFKMIKVNKELITAYEKIVLDLLDNSSDRLTRLFHILNVSISGSRKIGINFSQNLHNKAIDIISSKLADYFYRFDPEDIFMVLDQCSPTLRKPIINRCSKLLSESKLPGSDELFGTIDLKKYQESLIHQISLHMSWFEEEKNDIQKTIAVSYTHDLEIIEQLCQDNNLIKFFISKDALGKIVDQISDAEVQETKEGEKIKLERRIKILKSCDSLMNNNIKLALITKLDNLLKLVNPQPLTESKRQFLASLSTVLANFNLDVINNNKEITILSKDLLSGYNAAGSEQIRTEYIIPLILIEEKVGADMKSTINSVVTPFLTNTKPNLISEIVSKLTNLGVKKFIEEKYKSIFFIRASQYPAIFDSLWTNYGPELKDALFVNMIVSSHYMTAMNKIKSANYKVEKPSLIAQAIIEKLPLINANEKAEFYTALSALNCGDSQEILEKYIVQLRGELISGDMQREEIGYRALKEGKNSKVLNLETCKTIVNDLINSLEKIEILTQKNTFAFDTVIFLWNDLSLTHRDKFVTLIVYKLIEKNAEIETKKIGLSKLAECKPAYNDHESNFDHLLSIIEKIADANNKKIVADEFLKSMPTKEKMDKKEETFWNKVEKMTK
ncbi:MAG: P-loop NTPase fold protein [Candidatus Omnitrophica bacterium]|nr:P-loop NTPase fold protein [Candidatus Omnitrophota bacterium]